MKILMLTPYVTLNSRPEFSRNKTGFGYMVYDIAHAVGVTEQVDVLASDSRGEAFDIDGVHFLKRSVGLFLANFFRSLSPLVVLKLWKQYKMSKGALIRLVYYWIISGYYRNIIKTRHYDIVHIHGCGYSTELWMLVCKQCQQKFVVTLHGLNSFSDTVKIDAAGKQYERDFLKRVVDGEFSISVISTGMKRMIQRTYGITNCANIMVVCNSFSFSNNENTTLYFREQYGIPSEAKILLYVGNISENKNQLQMVKAFDLLPDGLRRQTWVLFCGENHMNDKTLLEKAINSCQNADHLILCGGIKKELMPSYYQAADVVVLLSKAEGFGLSLIEAMHFGLPCAMFKDMDAFEDIYDPCAVVPIEDRKDITVAFAIEKLLTTPWNSQMIKMSSKRFDNQTMAEKYKKVYELL